MLFSHYFECLNLNSKKFENPRWRSLVTSLCCCGRHGNQLSSKWFRLIESTKNAPYICAKYLVNRMNGVKSRGEGSDSPPPLMPSCNFFYLMPSRVKINDVISSPIAI